MSGDIAAIAAGLSEPVRTGLRLGRWNAHPIALALLEARLIARTPSPRQPLLNLELTPLGHAVRAYLEGQSRE